LSVGQYSTLICHFSFDVVCLVRFANHAVVVFMQFSDGMCSLVGKLAQMMLFYDFYDSFPSKPGIAYQFLRHLCYNNFTRVFGAFAYGSFRASKKP